MDVSAALAGFAALDDAVALGDAATGRTLGTTPRLRALLAAFGPDGARGARATARAVGRGEGGAEAAPPPWSTSWPALLDALDAGAAGGVVPERGELGDGVHAVRVPARDVQRYLAERDDLFLTSRTISIGEMATTLAHELNQPIGAISNLLGALKIRARRGSLGPGDLEPVLDAALEQARFGQSVIARIREFTRARRPEQRDLDLGTLARRSLALLDWLMASSGTRVALELPRERATVRGDATMLQQVLVNLLRNAVEAMRARPADARALTVSIVADGARWRVGIADRGHGLGGRDPGSLLVPFASTKPDGTGVGLAICRSFLELHQGRLWIADNEHGGCTAHVELPRAARGRGLDAGAAAAAGPAGADA